MPYAVELTLDPGSDTRVRGIWAALDAAGVPSVGSVPGATYEPHVSLLVLDTPDANAFVAPLREALAAAPGTPLPLDHLGFFLTDESVAFLGVRPTTALLALHAAAGAAVGPDAPVWPYYRPGRLVPHCTLAMGVADPGPVAATVRAFPLPVEATAAGAFLVEVPGGRHVERLA